MDPLNPNDKFIKNFTKDTAAFCEVWRYEDEDGNQYDMSLEFFLEGCLDIVAPLFKIFLGRDIGLASPCESCEYVTELNGVASFKN